MMSEPTAMGGNAVDYFHHMQVDDYMTSEGGPGFLHGKGLEHFGLVEGQKAERETFADLYDGYYPGRKEKAVQNAGTVGLPGGRQPGWNLVFRPGKDVASLWARATPEMRERIEKVVFLPALKEALSDLEESLTSRVGHGGEEKVKANLVMAVHYHRTSRAMDPLPHFHVLVLNLCSRVEDGKVSTGTVESKSIYARQKLFGALFDAAVYQKLEQLGFLSQGEGHDCKLQGIPQSLCDESSKRRKAIEQELRRTGKSGAAAAQMASLKTRERKRIVPLAELLSGWHEMCDRHGFSQEKFLSLIRTPPKRDPAQEIKPVMEAVEKDLTKRLSFFTEAKYLESVLVRARGKGLAVPFIQEAVRERLHDNHHLVHLGSRGRNELYTTAEMWETEQNLLAAVERSKGRFSHAVTEGTLSKVYAKRTLTAEQKEAVRQLTKGGELHGDGTVKGYGNVRVMVGMAGSGKSYTMAAVADAYRMEGYEMLACAISGKAAKGHEQDTGTKAVTIAKLIGSEELGFRGDLEKTTADTLKHHGRQLLRAALGKKTFKEERIRLTSKHVLVIEEAGMVDTKSLQKLLNYAENAEGGPCRVLLLGDPRQLQPVLAGAPLHAIAERVRETGHGYAELKTITRQEDPQDREIVHLFADGEAEKALRAMADKGRLHVRRSHDEAAQALLERWKTGGVRRPEEHLIFCQTNEETFQVNRMCQRERAKAGELHLHNLAINAGVARGGDRVLFTRNDRKAGVFNGDLGTVVGVDEDQEALKVVLDSGKTVLVSLDDYGRANVRLGYAITTHKGQGATEQNSYILSTSEMTDLHMAYVQASRHKKECHIFCNESEEGQGLMELAQRMSRERRKELAHEVRTVEGYEHGPTLRHGR